jgi:hypothetical protein
MLHALILLTSPDDYFWIRRRLATPIGVAMFYLFMLFIFIVGELK